MSGHLTEEQLNEVMTGNAGSAASQHLETCATCRHEAKELRQALQGFRDSIHATARAYKLPWRAPAQPVRHAGMGSLAQRWAFAAALVAILVVSALLLRMGPGRNSHQVAKSTGENGILVEVQADISQSVPSALAWGELLWAGAEEPPPATSEKAASAKPSRR